MKDKMKKRYHDLVTNLKKIMIKSHLIIVHKQKKGIY